MLTWIAATSLISVPAFAATPGSEFDLSRWVLQLPTGPNGSVDTISAADLTKGYTSDFFNLAADGAMTFFTPNNGSRTPNSKHPRTELREMQEDGVTPANWDPFDGKTHLLSVETKVTDAPSSLTIGQIHVGQVLRNNKPESVKPLMEIYYGTNGDITIGSNRDPFNATGGQIVFKIGNVPLNTKFSYQIKAFEGKLSVMLNGATAATWTIPSSFQDYGEYFKAGNYNQTKSSFGSGGTRMNIYALELSHQ